MTQLTGMAEEKVLLAARKLSTSSNIEIDPIRRVDSAECDELAATRAFD